MPLCVQCLLIQLFFFLRLSVPHVVPEYGAKFEQLVVWVVVSRGTLSWGLPHLLNLVNHLWQEGKCCYLRSLLEILSWSHAFKSTPNLCGDRAPVEYINGCQVIRMIAKTSLYNRLWYQYPWSIYDIWQSHKHKHTRTNTHTPFVDQHFKIIATQQKLNWIDLSILYRLTCVPHSYNGVQIWFTVRCSWVKFCD